MAKMKGQRNGELKVIEMTLADGLTDYLLEHPITQKYSDRINDKIRAEYGVIETIISHNPSVGNYYERILISNLADYLPSKWKIGTGFVFDDYSVQTSPQIDVIIYEDNELAPIFRAGDLVVVRPHQVRGIIEIKKKIKLSDIDDLIEKFAFVNTGSEFGSRQAIQVLNVFSYEKSSSVEKYFERVVRQLTKKIQSLATKENEGTERLCSIRNLTVPRIYFLDERKLINTKVNQKGLIHEVEVSIDGIMYSTGGASDLFSRFIWHSEEEELGRLHLCTTMLYESIQSEKIESPVILRQFIPIRKIWSQFSEHDRAIINKDRLNKLSGFAMPYGLKIENAEDLQNKIKAGIVLPILNGEKKANDNNQGKSTRAEI